MFCEVKIATMRALILQSFVSSPGPWGWANSYPGHVSAFTFTLLKYVLQSILLASLCLSFSSVCAFVSPSLPCVSLFVRIPSCLFALQNIIYIHASGWQSSFVNSGWNLSPNQSKNNFPTSYNLWRQSSNTTQSWSGPTICTEATAL